MNQQHRKKSHKLKTLANMLAIAGVTSSSLLSIPLATAATTTPNFTDVTANYAWAKQAIDTLAQDGIITGRSSTQFSPGDSITRAEFATLVVRALKLPIVNPTVPSFKDVSQQDGLYPYIETAYKYGIVNGTGTQENLTFSPNDPIKREDIVTMIINAIIKTKPTTYDLSGLLAFTDNSSIGSYAKINVALAVKLGIIKGYDDRTFRPLATADRAEAAQIIYNQLQVTTDQIKNALAPVLKITPTSKSLTVDDMQQFSAQATYADGTKSSYPLSWSVSGGIGTIDANGLFTATKAGSGVITATIHVMDGYDISSSAQVTVIPKVPKLSFSSSTYTVVKDASQKLPVILYDTQGNQILNPKVTYSLSGNIGSVDNSGQFQATSVGTGTVTATATLDDGTTATATATIQVIPKVSSISISPNSVKIAQNLSQTFTCVGTDSNGNQTNLTNVSWNVTGGIGTINQNGVFQATNEGTGTVTATFQQSANSTPLTASVPVQVIAPLSLTSTINATSFTPTQAIQVNVKAVDKSGQVATSDSGHTVTLTITKPDGSKDTKTATDQNGVCTFNLSYTQAGNYQAVVSGSAFTSAAPLSFQVVPGAPASLDVYGYPSPWVMPGKQLSIKAVAYDKWGNTVSQHLPVQCTLSTTSYGTYVTKDGTTGQDATVGTFTAGTQKGDINVNVTLSYQGTTLTKSTTLHVYTDRAGGLVSGKGVWVAPQLGDTSNIPGILQKFQAAGIKHIYLEVSDSNRGFYAKDVLENFLHQAHSMGFSVVGWIYSNLSNPSYDGKLAAQVASYVTKSGDRLDAIGADLEENMTASNVSTFAQTFRSSISNGKDYPFIAVTYPYSWRPSYPWTAIGQNFDAVVPMDYWHYRAKSYSYSDVYNTVKADITDIRKATGNPYMAVSIAGQAYNMFSDDPSQYPTATEVQAALQAAKDSGCVGYSAYRGPFADTDAEWNALANFKW